jgi:hypothetical protein
MRFGSWVALSAAAVLVLTSCSSRLGEQQGGSGGGGSGGSQSSTGPLAVATPIGHKPTSKAGVDPVTITVRSGADVLLSGKDTQSRGSPVTDFSWTQATGDASHVTLLYRTANTVDFTAPTVAASTVLNFTLTAQDSSGGSASAHVTVTVVPASDTSQFLTTAVTNPTQQAFQVAVVPLNGLSNLTADSPVCITLDRTIRYTNHNGQSASVTLARRPTDRVDAAWLQAAGAVGGTASASGPPDVSKGVASYTNPRATFSVPSLDEDDLFALYNQPPTPQLAQQLVAADMDSASLTVTVEATPGKCGSPATADSSNPLIVSIVNATAPLVTADPSKPPPDPANLAASAPAGTLALSLDALRQAVNGTSDCATASAGTARCTETSASAALYYQTVDPIGSAPRAGQTMNAWLDANCFNSGAANFGADTHAVYTNNFDLGFGRDMYFVTCTAKNLSQASVAAGRVAGDSASIVLNYPSLESVPLKQNPIIAVAMSHNAYSAKASAPLPGRVTKFFIFAPDDRDGGFYLVRSANFDHRGQKYVPGACTVCHGGTVNAANIASGDVDAAFMPWDESALLFSDTDPAYTGGIVPKTGYTEADQTAAIYALNQHAYATYLNSPASSQARFAAPKALIEKWYGGGLAATPGPSNQGNYTYTDITFKTQKFDESGFPSSAVDPASSWANENAANGDDIYHNVFAHECRSCHTQLHTSTPGAVATPYPVADQFNTYDDFKSEFIGNAHSIGSLVLGESVMPLARLTADRLWVNFNGGKSPATILANRVQVDASASGLVDTSGNAVPPGTPQVSPAFTQAPVSSPTSGTSLGANNAVKRLYQVRVDGISSLFVGGYAWSLCDPSGACTANLVGAASAAPAFAASLAGTYELSLSGTSTSGHPFGPLSYPLTVTRTNPAAPGCTYTVPVQPQSTSIALKDCATQPQDAAGQPNTTTFQLGDGTNTLTVSGWSPNNGYGPSSYTYSCDSTAPTCRDSMSINVTVAQNNGPSVLSYNLCDDPPGQVCSPGAIKVVPTAGPSAQNSVYYATLPLVAGATSAAAPLASPSLTLSASGGVYAGQIPIDSTPAVGPCAGVPGDAGSLARSFTVAPCTDSFTLAFGAAAALGPFNLGGTDTYALSLPLSQFPNCTAAGVCGAAPYSVGYTIKDTATIATPNTAGAQLQVNIVATQSFSGTVTNQGNIYSYLDTAWACTGCHSGTQTGTTNTMAPYFWTDGSGDSAVAYGTLKGSNCSGVSCINTAAPASSRLYINACVGPHTGGNAEQRDTTVAIEAQRCANLLQWLTEGAQNN